MPISRDSPNDIGGGGDATDSSADFAFVPRELAAQCRSLIERYHRVHGCTCLPDMLWHADSRGLIQSHKELKGIFKKASMARGVKRANSSLLSIATVIVALEALVRNFAGWGAQFPDARQKAEKLLGEAAPGRRVWLMDAYLHVSHGIDRGSVLGLAPLLGDGR